jgi:hypothetical protein
MQQYTRCRVLLPARITKEQTNWTEQNFLFIVRNYLMRYPNYELIRVENGFAICDREDEVRERRKRS